jgi:hypothetical protein
MEELRKAAAEHLALGTKRLVYVLIRQFPDASDQDIRKAISLERNKLASRERQAALVQLRGG